MSPEAIAAIRDSIKNLFDLLTILGPAAITGYLGYKMGKRQIELKLHELDKQNEFGARKSLFDHYKDMRKEANEIWSKLQNTIGQFIALAGDTIKDIDADIHKDHIDFIVKFIESYKKNTPEYIKWVKGQMEKLDLTGYAQYSELEKFQELASNIVIDRDTESIKNNLFVLHEGYSHLQICYDLILQEKAEQLFGPYVDIEILK